jgi:hypothetical protein
MRLAPPPPPPARALLVLLGSACASFSGSSTIPVPVTIGEPRVVGTDTEYVLRGPGYVLVSPRREVLPDARETLDGAVRQFRRYFATDPESVTIRLQPTAGAGAFTAGTPSSASSPELVVPLVSLPKGRSRQAPSALPLGLAQTAARAWVARYVRGRARDDSLAASGGPASGEPASGRAPDPALPDWLLVAIPELVAASPREDFLIAQLARQSELTPLHELFTMRRPAPPPSARASGGGKGGQGTDDGGADAGDPSGTIPMGDGRGRGGFGGGFGRGGFGKPSMGMKRTVKLSPWVAFQAEALAVARFLVEREGPGFIGHVVDRVSRGASMEAALGDARLLPRSVDELDAAWRSWLRDQATTAPGFSRFAGPRGNRDLRDL